MKVGNTLTIRMDGYERIINFCGKEFIIKDRSDLLDFIKYVVETHFYGKLKVVSIDFDKYKIFYNGIELFTITVEHPSTLTPVKLAHIIVQLLDKIVKSIKEIESQKEFKARLYIDTDKYEIRLERW